MKTLTYSKQDGMIGQDRLNVIKNRIEGLEKIRSAIEYFELKSSYKEVDEKEYAWFPELVKRARHDKVIAQMATKRMMGLYNRTLKTLSL